MSSLTEKHCTPCEGGVPPMSQDEIKKQLAELKGWSVNDKQTQISKRFEFKNFYKTMAFVNAVAWIANNENHHPDLEVTYSACTIHYSTHAINGLSINDFICAAKIDVVSTL
jgi:4a-hydroxytetrahydrobiopterin dehydratase